RRREPRGGALALAAVGRRPVDRDVRRLHGVARAAAGAARAGRREAAAALTAQPKSCCQARPIASASVAATKAMPASAPLRCASWLMRPPGRRDATQVYAR